ncbi:NAD-dependent epimerase/dehydratase family protein [Heliobacterium gestii]|uniref:GDP-L-fucose synthase n=1 Tax=Heliomicrobium gestii TaxID=2699 RepID=A0A845L5N0_HELGE|nr:GDP-L-fucose synthase [Heliomicrobium gestii]MBM7865253.1 GDP-L-fucose synthase [Heliomicrobium gestii]MZP41518.1 NAD-dependent epimerase/dehydratase family protein [Heliomicrobium gestii]
MDRNDRIFVAGHRGLVGSAIVRKLRSLGYERLILQNRSDLDLRDQKAVKQFFAQERPDYVIVAAAKVGGIYANNSFPAEFIYDNLMIQTNVIHHAYESGVNKLLFLGSSCIYPKYAPQPMAESCLLTGALEPTNEPYAVAKIAGIKLCESYNRQYGTNFIVAMPTNLYGPNDCFDLQSAHVLPALIRKFHEGKQQNASEVPVWGTGRVRREFLHVDDLGEACVFLLHHFDAQPHSAIINVGTGTDVTIAELAEMIAATCGFRGKVVFDSRMPDGTPQKLLDVSKINGLGWKARIPLEQGIQQTYEWYRQAVKKT